jgi:hypothetical protein
MSSTPHKSIIASILSLYMYVCMYVCIMALQHESNCRVEFNSKLVMIIIFEINY